MIYQFVSLFILAAGLCSTYHCMGQTECEDLKLEAKILEEEINEARLSHKAHLTEIEFLNQEARNLGLELPTLKAYTAVSPQDPKYSDLYLRADNFACPDRDRRNGDLSMNYILYLRTYKRDSLEGLNQQLERQIQILDKLLRQSSPSVQRPTTSSEGYNQITEGFYTKRAIIRGKTYVVTKVDPSILPIKISEAPQNPRTHSFENISIITRRPVIFAMNAGMFDSYRKPVGLLIKDRRIYGRLNRDTRGYGNFYMQPNGVFYVDVYGRADVIPTQQFVSRSPRLEDIQAATQSGPMMIINGEINANFTQGSQNVHFRNAVGVTRNGKVIFAISKQRVNFYEFASFLRDLGCTNALYLDGEVSRMYLPTIGETSALYDSNHLGPIFYILE